MHREGATLSKERQLVSDDAGSGACIYDLQMSYLCARLIPNTARSTVGTRLMFACKDVTNYTNSSFNRY